MRVNEKREGDGYFRFYVFNFYFMDMHMAGSPLQNNEIENVNNGMKAWKSRSNRAKDKKK